MTRFVLLAAVLAATAAPAFAVAPGQSPLRPVDPFDYSYCGGQPVYPVIGFNFSTYCGPRNQVALGRRGKLMWLFPDADNLNVLHRGTRQLKPEELARLTLLAEIAQFADAPPAGAAPVRFSAGINFQGRRDKRQQGALTSDYTPSSALFRAMMDLVPDDPLLPQCADATPVFDPTLLPAARSSNAATPARRAGAVTVALRNAATRTELNGLRVEPAKRINAHTLIDDEGRATHFPVAGKQWRLVLFGYTHCPDICPMTLHKFGMLMRELGEASARLTPVFISVDSGRDNPKAMRAYTEKFHPRITGLTGDAEQLIAIANSFGVMTRRYQGKTALAYTLEHSSLLYLLDPQGEVRLIYPATVEVTAIATDLRKLWNVAPTTAAATHDNHAHRH